MLGRGVGRDEAVVLDRCLVERVMLRDVPVLVCVGVGVSDGGAPTGFQGVGIFQRQQELRAAGLNAVVPQDQRAVAMHALAPWLAAFEPERAIRVAVAQRGSETVVTQIANDG